MAVKQLLHPRNITETETKLGGMGDFSKGEIHCNHTGYENIILSHLSSAAFYFFYVLSYDQIRSALPCIMF